MNFLNTQEEYGSVTKFFHWSIAFLILGLLLLGFAVTFMDGFYLQKPLVTIHKFFGLLVLILVILRILWIEYSRRPHMVIGLAKWERFSAHMTHGLLYFFMFAMPISGWIMSTAANKAPHILEWSFPFIGIPKSKSLAHQFFIIHKYAAWILVFLLAIHIIAALRHHFIIKDIVLKRMLPNMKDN